MKTLAKESNCSKKAAGGESCPVDAGVFPLTTKVLVLTMSIPSLDTEWKVLSEKSKTMNNCPATFYGKKASNISSSVRLTFEDCLKVKEGEEEKPVRCNKAKVFTIDTKKANDALDMKENTNLQDGIMLGLDYYLQLSFRGEHLCVGTQRKNMSLVHASKKKADKRSEACDLKCQNVKENPNVELIYHQESFEQPLADDTSSIKYIKVNAEFSAPTPKPDGNAAGFSKSEPIYLLALLFVTLMYYW